MSALALTVDQSLVDQYLARVDRFVNNIRNFDTQLKGLLHRSEPAVSEVREPVRQAVETVQPERAVVTADDIDIDALLNGIDLGGVSL